ncbi:MAG: hypothetical protein K0R11_2313 [Acidimicrobiales bacterium]|jgi:hypothetical protein|nr:hypothetical protein [Acidimicrobiales bacterium]
MAIDVDTKDTTALGDAELTTLGDICADGPAQFDIGLLSKQREEWVLITTAKSGSALQGFSFCTLERIGGTPCVLIGLASVKRTGKRTEVLKALMADQYRRAVLAFPDEDVLIGTRFIDPSGFEAFSLSRVLEDVVPRPGHKATGEERAWGRRLAKRFGVDADYDDRAFVAKGDGAVPCVLDHESLKPGVVSDEVRALFDAVDTTRGDSLIAFGWAMAEDLAALA